MCYATDTSLNPTTHTDRAREHQKTTEQQHAVYEQQRQREGGLVEYLLSLFNREVKV